MRKRILALFLTIIMVVSSFAGCSEAGTGGGNDVIEAAMDSVTPDYDEFSDILKELPEPFRVVVVMYYYDELTLKEIAKILSVPVGTVKSRLSRAKTMLKDILEGGGKNG